MNLERTVALTRDRVHAHLAGRSGTWLASFAEVVAMAEQSGMPTGGLHPVPTSHLGDDGDVLDHDKREALIDALVGRWAAARYLERETKGSSEAEVAPDAGPVR